MNDRQKRRELSFIAGFRSALLICSIHVHAIKLLLHFARLPLWNNINRTVAKRAPWPRGEWKSLSVGWIEPSEGRWCEKKFTISLLDVSIVSDQSFSERRLDSFKTINSCTMIIIVHGIVVITTIIIVIIIFFSPF